MRHHRVSLLAAGLLCVALSSWACGTRVAEAEIYPGQTYLIRNEAGGYDGRLDFTQNFMQRIVELGLHEAKPKKSADALGTRARRMPPSRIRRMSNELRGEPNVAAGNGRSSTLRSGTRDATDPVWWLVPELGLRRENVV